MFVALCIITPGLSVWTTNISHLQVDFSPIHSICYQLQTLGIYYSLSNTYLSFSNCLIHKERSSLPCLPLSTSLPSFNTYVQSDQYCTSIVILCRLHSSFLSAIKYMKYLNDIYCPLHNQGRVSGGDHKDRLSTGGLYIHCYCPMSSIFR
jgi:hypothetical protein